MKIKLSYFLSKKDITLKHFCNLNNLKSYKDLVEYCEKKRYIPISSEEYQELIPPIPKEEKVETPKPQKKKATKARRSRKAPKKESVRNNTKAGSNTP